LALTQRRPHRRAADLAWGARNGILLAAIVLIPAGVAAASSSSRELGRFSLIASAYLAFGAIAGLIIGIARRRLAQKFSAIAIGALIGGLGFSLLLAFADPRPGSRVSLIASGCLLGIAVGGSLGWWAWRRADAWHLR
jgi:hypothetical protein